MIDVRTQLYMAGIRMAIRFCNKNKLPLPRMFTYQEAEGLTNRAGEMLRRTRNGRLVGSGTGLYYDGYLFVNVPVTALPVQQPRMRSWSYPCWKTDRTAMGVVAHELGHHVEALIAHRGYHAETLKWLADEWRDALKGKRVSGYEPVPSESFAESMRLFILNPELLKLAIPRRYEYIRDRVGLKPCETRPWQKVLLHHPPYVEAGKRWIAK